MGYYTDFRLEGVSEEIIKDINDTIFEMDVFYSDGYCDSSMKWYNWTTDMKEFSKKYPLILIKLCGIGEDPEDIWEAYFRGGKMQMCWGRIEFDEFNEELLS